MCGLRMSWPFYVIESGRRKGEIRQFLFVSESEYNQLGERRSKEIEFSGIRSKRVSGDPSLKAKWSARRSERRKTEHGLREREFELRRNRRRIDSESKVEG